MNFLGVDGYSMLKKVYKVSMGKVELNKIFFKDLRSWGINYPWRFNCRNMHI